VIYEPYMDEMYMHKLRLRIMNDKTFLRVLTTNLTDEFISAHRKIVDPNHLHTQNTVWQIYGETGGGKSSIALSLCKMLTPERFSYKNFCFYDQQILDKAKTLPQNTFIIRDEGTDKAQFGVGSMRTGRQLQVMAETCRKAGLNLVFIEPEERTNEIAKYYIEVFDMDVKNRLTRCAIKEPKLRQYMGAIYVPVVPETDPDWVAYNEVKDSFIEDIKAGKSDGSKTDYRAIARQYYDQIDIDVFRTKSERLSYLQAELAGMTNGEVKIVSMFIEVMLKHGENAIDKDA